MALRTDMLESGVCDHHLKPLDDMIRWANDNEEFIGIVLEHQNLTWSQDCGPLTNSQELEIRAAALASSVEAGGAICLNPATLGMVISNLTIEECLEINPEEPEDFLDFDPVTGHLYERE